VGESSTEPPTTRRRFILPSRDLRKTGVPPISTGVGRGASPSQVFGSPPHPAALVTPDVAERSYTPPLAGAASVKFTSASAAPVASPHSEGPAKIPRLDEGMLLLFLISLFS